MKKNSHDSAVKGWAVHSDTGSIAVIISTPATLICSGRLLIILHEPNYLFTRVRSLLSYFGYCNKIGPSLGHKLWNLIYLKPIVCFLKFVFKLKGSFVWLEHFSPDSILDLSGLASNIFLNLWMLGIDDCSLQSTFTWEKSGNWMDIWRNWLPPNKNKWQVCNKKSMLIL